MAASVDFVVVGSGAGGLAGAIAAKLNGLNPVVIEKAALWGGTSALSGGGVWIPNNHLMKRDNIPDSYEEAMAYLEATVGEVGPASSRERKHAYLDAGPKMVRSLEKLGFTWIRAPKYPDYYQKMPGAKVGRTLEASNFDANRLGAMLHTMRRNMMRPLAITTDAAPKIPTMLRSFNSLMGVMTVVARTLKFRIKGQVPLSMGQTLVAQLMAVVQSLDIPVRLDTPLKELVQDDAGRVIGVKVTTAQGEETIAAPRGVLMAAGGFAKDAAYRMPLQGVTGEWSPASPDDTGDGHKIGAAIGAELALMDSATWYPVSISPDGTINVGIWERTLPGSIIVDQSGQRYTNEAASYVDAGRAMLERDKTVPAVPSWLVFDTRYRNRYFFGQIPPRVTRQYVESGFFQKGETLEELAGKCGIDAAGLVATVTRVNSMAAAGGVDADFDRGDNVYDEYYGDPAHRPNRSFGPVDAAPFYAVRYWPGDLSTKGGLMADAHARVLRADGSVIEGLYVAGNNAAPVMGRTYPGAGATIGPSMVFAWIAGHHAAGADVSVC
ncbi:3-ketosteroid delta(1)-dehydrogenase [Caenibius tardaugens NBRC 16725]|uniref:3-oxosteroid 1-dehydrogenase n=1 Tax=Caenibius tardaugens NBRC 16725 TaxID=1219035 RepID=U2YIR5_9SPHN|nr:FAD-binding protein [Caenibius tardaugens]GAD48245.1 3-ketosteroid delta(1)-dehydrogenase [Caenibius tardaugens NBRC 16725]